MLAPGGDEGDLWVRGGEDGGTLDHQSDRIRMRVWERGTGITLASGSSSCATGVAAARRGLTGRKVDIVLDGGTLVIDWREDGVWMTGPVAHVFDAVLTADWLGA